MYWLSVWPHASSVDEISMCNLHITRDTSWSWNKVMNGSSSKGLCETICARWHWTSRRPNLEAALSPSRGEPCTSPAVKQWRWKTVMRRRRSGNSSHMTYIQSENHCHSYREYYSWRGIIIFSLCVCHLSKGTHSRELPSYLGEFHCWVCHSHTNSSKKWDVNRWHTWEFSQNVTKLLCYCLQN